MMTRNPPVPHEGELRRTVMACQVMFHTQPWIARPLVGRLHPADIDVIYQSAVEGYALTKYHPDPSQNRLHKSDLARWGTVFAVLRSYLDTRTLNQVGTDVGTRKAVPSRHYFCGETPRRPLRLGNYLYYSRIISKETLMEAIEWQRAKRPMFGQIAIRKGYLTAGEFARILARLGRGNYFGDAARTMGLMTPAQVDDVLKEQARLDRPIGRFFVERGLLSEADLSEILRALTLHNSECGTLSHGQAWSNTMQVLAS